MEFKKIFFHSNRISNEYKDVPAPEPASKNTPKWYQDSDIYIKMPNGEPARYPDGSRALGYKSCPAILDLYTTGYVLKTPCDIEFYIDKNGKIASKIQDHFYKDFCHFRPEMPQFEHPEGYYKDHFAWFPDWATKTPEGYSVLYTQPFNRFELPFMTTSGIIDNDQVHFPGSMPFFVRDGFIGVISAGTPFVQMFPFKREDWESEIEIKNPGALMKDNMENSQKYRKPDGGIYKNEVWSPRKYS